MSGESGAGKTEATKSLMKMLAAASSRSAGNLTQTERYSNSLLEVERRSDTLRNCREEVPAIMSETLKS